MKTIRKGSHFSFFQQKLKLHLTVLESDGISGGLPMVTSTDDPGAW